MVVKLGIKTLLRTPLKTGLFIVLLFTVTLLLCLGATMGLTAENSLHTAEQAFDTICVIEYRDSESPVQDAHMYNYDYSPIKESSLVQSFDQRLYLAGLAENIDLDIAYKATLHCLLNVVEISPIERTEASKIRARIDTVLYSYDSMVTEGATVIIQFPVDSTFTFEQGKKYVSAIYETHEGEYVVEPDFIYISLQSLGCLISREKAAMEITDGFYTSEEGQAWLDIATVLANTAKTLTVVLTDDTESILAFHQHKALITSGRTLSDDDYRLGNRVCLIEAGLASSQNIALGDAIPIKFFEHSIMSRDNEIMCAHSVDHRALSWQENFTVVGFYQVVGKMTGGYGFTLDTIFVPRRSVDYWPEDYSTYDNHISFRIPNGKVEAFLDEMDNHHLPGLVFTFYDQGYSKAAGALAAMEKTGRLLTIICALTSFGVVLLFSMLILVKQLPCVGIMYSLGATRRKALGFLLTTILVVAILGVGSGGLAGYCLSEKVLSVVYKQNIERVSAASAFSGVYGDDAEADFQYIASGRFGAAAAATGMVLLVTLVVSSYFAVRITGTEAMKLLGRQEE